MNEGALHLRITLGGLLCIALASPGFAQEPSPQRPPRDTAVTLAPVEVTVAPLKTAEFRRRDSHGRFLTREQLARQENRRFGDVVKAMGGVKIFTERGSAYAVTNRGRNTIYGANARCLLSVYLDGAMVYGGSDRATEGLQQGFDLNQLLTSDVDRVDLYASAAEVPAEYNRTGATCGVLLIWTRQR